MARFRKKLEEYMDAYHFSAADIYRPAGINPTVFSLVYNGKRMPNMAFAQKICKATKGYMKPEDFFDLR